MKGTDIWHGSGFVTGRVEFGRTHGGNEACSFRIGVDDDDSDRTTLVRVNVYGGNVEVVKRRELVDGDYVIVSGEMMTRSSDNRTVAEVRCVNIVIASGGQLEAKGGTNQWTGSGNIAGNIDFGETRSGEDACSFRVAIEKHHSSVYLRVNAFDGVASELRDQGVGIGDYVMLRGEIMNRRAGGKWLSELRCLSVYLVKRKSGDVKNK